MTATQGLRVAPLVALRFADDRLYALDQTLLPWREQELECVSAADVADAIRRLAIRGAPLIGVAAAYGVALELASVSCTAEADRDAAIELARGLLRDARPTAVNLAGAVDRVCEAATSAAPGEAADAALAEARAIHAEEEAASEAIAALGSQFLRQLGARRILTHCNTGALAAPGRGTALAVIAELARTDRLVGVIACESRPLLQGARLTVYELARLGIDHELVVDAAAPSMIAGGVVDAVIVGCDRVAANGDVANKIGTYPLALAASAAQIPFLVAGPSSSIDPSCPTGAQIEIEERDPDEVRGAAGARLTPPATKCRNPAFDVTPAGLVTALVTESGIAAPPDLNSIRALVAG